MLPYVEPTDWFYQEAEVKKGEPIPREKEYVTDITKSVNFLKLQELKKNRLLNRFCVENFEDKSQNYLTDFVYMLSGRNLISPNLIRELKNTLPVIDWFRE